VIYETKNLSPANKKSLEEGTLLPLMEQFYTIQGEGFNTGKAAYFIRLGGCDVGCHWCDVKESWDASVHPLTSTEKIIDDVLAANAKAVVVTGGEPLHYNLDPLTNGLKKKNIETFIETSGAYPLSGEWDWICLSPKKTALPLPAIYQRAHELKMIIHNRHDLKWAEEEAKKINPSCHLFLQPEWSKRNEMTLLIIDYVKANPQWMISLQTHKYMNIP
jgi:organic radical activating enzyme